MLHVRKRKLANPYPETRRPDSRVIHEALEERLQRLNQGVHGTARLVDPVRSDQQARQADHGVAAPIGEPRISRDNGLTQATLDHVRIAGARD